MARDLPTSLVYARNWPLVGQLAYYALKLLGVEMPRSTPVGEGFELAHGGAGVVVHSSAKIGARVKIYPGVTLGRADIHRPMSESRFKGIVIEDDVILCPGAKILCKEGVLRVRRGSVIGANAVLLQSTGENEIWAGVPADCIGRREVSSMSPISTVQNPKRICIVPRVSGIGGMVSFRHKITAGLEQRSIAVSHDLADTPYHSVLVIGGTRRLASLWRARRRGIRVVQRLDGMNWMHRLPPTEGGSKLARRTGWRHFLRAEYGNMILATIRARLASRVVYQSRFVQAWWEREKGPTSASSAVIHNGVDLEQYNPNGPGAPPLDRIRVLMVEGSLMGGYEGGLAAGMALAQGLSDNLDRPVELMVVGRVAEQVREDWNNRIAAAQAKFSLVWTGPVDREAIPQIDRSAHLLYSSDINAACPNAVIEALACGLPVVSFNSGAIPELVSGDSGRVAPYGSDPWQLQTPDTAGLVKAALEILENQDHHRLAARRHAETAFSLDKMVQAYIDILL